MKTKSQDDKPEIKIADLYPTLNPAQLQEAEENLERYLELALRIYERVRNDPKSYQQFKLLTGRSTPSSMHGEKVNGSQPPLNPSQT